MTRGVLESKAGDCITWYEAVIRATKGLGRPAPVREIADYLLLHEITGFPETAKTPLQTIYNVLYAHSQDSASWRNNERVFYSAGKGKWGLLNPDKWRKRRSAKKCHPLVARALEDRKLFKSEEMRACCAQLREEAREWELLFGEIMLLSAAEDIGKTAEVYFPFIWSCARHLGPLTDLYIWEITDDLVRETLQGLSSQRALYATRWVNRARKSPYNTKPPESDYGMRLRPEKAHRQNSYSHFFHSISFPEGYVPPARVQTKTLFKYFLWRYGGEYTESYVVRTLCVSYSKLEPLHEKPFCLVRPQHVRECMEGLSASQRNKIVVLYRKLDGLAYEFDLIPKRYSLTMHHARASASEPTNEFTQEEIDLLRRNEGEIEVDLTLVLLYTGLYIRELCALTSADVGDGCLCLPNDKTLRYGRNIPIHPAIVRPLRHVLRYLEDKDIRNVKESRRRYGVFQMVRAATEKCCGTRHSASQCRSSFEARLKEAGASSGVLLYLMGTVQCGLKEYQRTYIHPSDNNIKLAVMALK